MPKLWWRKERNPSPCPDDIAKVIADSAAVTEEARQVIARVQRLIEAMRANDVKLGA